MFSKTYMVDVTYLDRDENGVNRVGTIEIPYMSSQQLFNLMDTATMRDLAAGKETNLNTVLFTLGKAVVEVVCPKGLLDDITPRSGIQLMTKVLDMERDSIGLGETKAQETTPALTSSDSQVS
jgi:hypothetical protein